MKSSARPRVASPGVPAATPRAARLAGGGAGTWRRLTPARKAAELLLWLLLLLPPWYASAAAKDSFRLPKLMLSEWLAVASLVPLVWGLRQVERIDLAAVWRLPAVRAALPLLIVATFGLATSAHPLHVREGLTDMWIGGACLVGWSLGVADGRLSRLLGGLVIPGVVLAVIGILQFHGVQSLPLAGVHAGSRFAITSRAGNPGDLGAFLVLPCLAAQWQLARSPLTPRRRALLAAALALCIYGLLLTQTFAAIAALLLGSLLFWALALRRGSAGIRRLAIGVAAVAILVALSVTAVPALRARVAEKLGQAAHGDWNAVLTGRFDGWRTAVWMLGQHPLAGVGQGAYRAEFVPAKLALIGHGAVFFSGQQQNFVNAHDELLEVAADCGLPGLLALAWGLGVLALALRSRLAAARPRRRAPAEATADAAAAAGDPLAGRRIDAAFGVAGAAAVGALALVDFPFRIALVAFPALLLLAWILRPDIAVGAVGAVGEAA